MTHQVEHYPAFRLYSVDTIFKESDKLGGDALIQGVVVSQEYCEYRAMAVVAVNSMHLYFRVVIVPTL